MLIRMEITSQVNSFGAMYQFLIKGYNIIREDKHWFAVRDVKDNIDLEVIQNEQERIDWKKFLEEIKK